MRHWSPEFRGSFFRKLPSRNKIIKLVLCNILSGRTNSPIVAVSSQWSRCLRAEYSLITRQNDNNPSDHSSERQQPIWSLIRTTTHLITHHNNNNNTIILLVHATWDPITIIALHNLLWLMILTQYVITVPSHQPCLYWPSSNCKLPASVHALIGGLHVCQNNYIIKCSPISGHVQDNTTATISA